MLLQMFTFQYGVHNNASRVPEHSCAENKSQYHSLNRYKPFSSKIHLKNKTNFASLAVNANHLCTNNNTLIPLSNVGVLWNI